MRLREVYEAIRDGGRAAAAETGKPWYLAINGYNSLGWDNAAVTAWVADLPMGEIVFRGQLWPEANFSAFVKTIAAMGKPFSPMYYPGGGTLLPFDDRDTHLMVTYLADHYASGGVAQYQNYRENAAVDRYLELIQSDPGIFDVTDNRVGLYYSLGNHMGDVGRFGVDEANFYGAAALLEDSHLSYDVLYQGDPDMGPGTVRWVDLQVSAADLATYDIVVLPNTKYMTDAEVAKLKGYAEAGGMLVVFGSAGAWDYSFPDPVERAVQWPEGVIAFEGEQNLGSSYDGNPDPVRLAAFAEALNLEDPLSGLGRNVHVHRYTDRATGRSVLHLVNYDYDAATDTVIRLVGARIGLRVDDTSGMALYRTPEDPDGVVLQGEMIDGLLWVVVPDLHAYGLLTVG
jgi:hypothetical protein